MSEVAAAAELITSMVESSAVVKIGATIDESQDDDLNVTVLAAGFPDSAMRPDQQAKTPVVQRETSFDIQTQNAQVPVSFGSSERSATPVQQDTEADELDIPAFLRRK